MFHELNRNEYPGHDIETVRSPRKHLLKLGYLDPCPRTTSLPCFLRCVCFSVAGNGLRSIKKIVGPKLKTTSLSVSLPSSISIRTMLVPCIDLPSHLGRRFVITSHPSLEDCRIPTLKASPSGVASSSACLARSECRKIA